MGEYFTMKIHEIVESASAGATSSGNVASVVNPSVAHSKKKPMMQKPTDNALDADTSLFNGGVLKRNKDTALGSVIR